MAQRRMFSPGIVQSDAFLDMPLSSQALYFHLGMAADDDGFVNPKKIMRMIGTNADDLQVLIAKRFVLSFENGVVVIKHWRMNNLVRKDWYRATQYEEQKAVLYLKENGSYTMSDGGKPLATIRQPFVNEKTTVRSRRLGKVRLGKVSNTPVSQSEPELIVKLIDSFEPVNPSFKTWYKRTTQREAADRLIQTHGLQKLLAVVSLLQKTNGTPFFPTITSPTQLEDKWAALEVAMRRKKEEITNRKQVFI